MGNEHNDEMEIDLLELIDALRKKILYIIAAGLLGACISAAGTQFLITPTYTSTASMLVLTKETTLSSLADLQIGSQLTSDYSILTTSRPVLEEVIENLDLDLSYQELKGMITINNPESTRIMELTVTNSSPQMAKNIVNELSVVAAEFIGDKMEVIPPKIVEEGVLPTGKTSPSMMKNTILGMMFGLIVACGVIVLITIMDDTIKTEEDVQKYLGLSMLASIPDRQDFIGGKRKKKRKKKSKKEQVKKNFSGKE